MGSSKACVLIFSYDMTLENAGHGLWWVQQVHGIATSSIGKWISNNRYTQMITKPSQISTQKDRMLSQE
jgi:hypothetical protein